jgi:hypothetical protein
MGHRLANLAILAHNLRRKIYYLKLVAFVSEGTTGLCDHSASPEEQLRVELVLFHQAAVRARDIFADTSGLRSAFQFI